MVKVGGRWGDGFFFVNGKIIYIAVTGFLMWVVKDDSNVIIWTGTRIIDNIQRFFSSKVFFVSTKLL